MFPVLYHKIIPEPFTPNEVKFSSVVALIFVFNSTRYLLLPSFCSSMVKRILSIAECLQVWYFPVNMRIMRICQRTKPRSKKLRLRMYSACRDGILYEETEQDLLRPRTDLPMAEDVDGRRMALVSAREM